MHHYEVADIFYQLGSHVNHGLREKIECGEYVELSKLLHNNRPSNEDHRLNLFNREGQMYLMSNADKDAPTINSFECWEQASRVYTGIYSCKNPHRSSEIFQHMANIHDTAVICVGFSLLMIGNFGN